MSRDASVYNPSSFRDPSARVFTAHGRIFRALNPAALEDWRALTAAPFFRTLVAAGKIVRTDEVTDAAVRLPADSGDRASLLEHERIPVISYPYEWPFGMLKDAAVLMLDVVRAALADDFILKDGTPFNVQWVGTRPVFVDVGSITRLRAGRAWDGYRQFCQMCLYPLLLQAYKDIEFQPWLRGRLEGVLPSECRALFSLRDALRPGVLTHVILQAALERRSAAADRNVKAELSAAGFGKALIDANITRLQKLVRDVTWKRATSTWSDYGHTHSYETDDQQQKQTFVRDAVRARPRHLVWDLGSNTGTFSRIAAEHAEYVIAVDADQLSIERLYQSLKANGPVNILPLIGNVADPAPGLGWRGRERTPLAERARPDLILCLALVHHVALSANIPLVEFVDWLASLGADVVIEFVAKQDEMAQRLLRSKDDVFPDYAPAAFEAALRRHFEIAAVLPLKGGTRTIYHAVHRVP